MIMKIKKLYKIGVVFCLLVLILILFFRIVNKGVEDTNKIQTAKIFTTNELLSKLQYTQEKLEGFIEKAIEVEGEIKEITFQDGKYSLILKGNSNKTFILCEMQSNQSNVVEKLHQGQRIKLKGILKGFLMDIILLHCVII